jgi:tetratricopeptide (TPR) repeat protein
MSNLRFQKLLEMIELEPQDSFLQYALAMEYLGMSETQQAEKIFRQIINADEHHVASYYQIGKLLETTNEAEAISFFEKGMEEAKVKGDQKTVNEFRTALDELLY